ncbi:hypothetical protein QLL95_gp1036 [Cotonvirus japonicus]|uniref:Uncharacterized protein n=1 Tax=Cotonvirus japonicus TaxID=2811091 RepID=A0ABM7NSL9_9VIRU|nr:hypothetical protein QLL95_gp1036 [Cotonvirus japonicus]BCS83087.1 hypothetical protein [Cotonvirus japonicus]
MYRHNKSNKTSKVNKSKKSRSLKSLGSLGSSRKLKNVKKNRNINDSINFNNEDNLFDMSEILMDNDLFVNKILNENTNDKRQQMPHQLSNMSNETKPAYLSQFDVQTFDATGNPSAVNDIYQTNDKARLSDLERQLSYQEGWSQYGDDNIMNYNIVADNEFVHNNMVPNIKLKNGYGDNDLHNTGVMNYKNQLFTGNLRDTWKSKTEVKPHFEASDNFSNPYGTPIYSEEQRDRVITGRYRQNEKPFESINTTPGLNLKYNENATHGCHPTYRALDKTVDELRVKPKITYETRVIDGMKGNKGAIQAPVISYKPDTYKITTRKDLLPTGSSNAAPKTRDNFIMRDTSRQHQHIEYTGGAYSSADQLGKNIPEHMREKHKSSTRQNFLAPKPLQKHGKSDAKFNPNLGSYDLPYTMRDQSVHNNYTGSTASVHGSMNPSNLMDNAKSTLRQITATKPVTNTIITPNTMRGTAHNMDIAKSTTRETLNINNNIPIVTGLNTASKVYLSDISKPTIRETTIDALAPFNCHQNNNMYAEIMDSARQTMQETTIGLHRNNNIIPVNQQQGKTNIQDTLKSTMHETTLELQRNNNIIPVNQQQRACDIQDILKPTLRETTENIPQNTYIIPVGQQQRAVNVQNIFNPTTRETTLQLQRNNNLVPVGQQQRASNPQNIFETTLRETTECIPQNSYIIPVGQQQRAVNVQHALNPTLRETTNILHRNSNTTPVGQQQRTTNPNDIFRTTTRETIKIPYNNFITPINQQQRPIGVKDNLKTNMRETTIGIHRNNQFVPIGQQQRATNIQDELKTNMRETTVGLARNNNVVPVGQQQRTTDLYDNLKPTVRETVIEIPRNNIIIPVGQQQRATNIQDELKTNMRETTIGLTRNNNVVPVGQQQRSSNLQDIARTTGRETIKIPYNTIVTPINQQKRGEIQDIAKSTIRQTTVTIPQNNILTPVGQQQRSMDIQHALDPTLRETILSHNRNNVITGVNNQHGPVGVQDKIRNTIKELITETPRNTNLGSGNRNLGKAHTFDRTPLKTTTRQILSTLPQNTHATAVGQQQRAANVQDQIRTTLKEQTIQIPYNTNTTVVNQQKGKSHSFNGQPLKSTTKETTIDNEYIGQIDNNVYGTGYGYMAEKYDAPNTNKQFTCQEVYITPLQGEQREKSYTDAYNMTINDKRQHMENRAPTNCGVAMSPMVENVNARLRNDDHESREPIMGVSFNNKLDRLKTHTHVKNSNNVSEQRFIDPVLVSQLQTNPYNINYFDM